MIFGCNKAKDELKDAPHSIKLARIVDGNNGSLFGHRKSPFVSILPDDMIETFEGNLEDGVSSFPSIQTRADVSVDLEQFHRTLWLDQIAAREIFEDLCQSHGLSLRLDLGRVDTCGRCTNQRRGHKSRRALELRLLGGDVLLQKPTTSDFQTLEKSDV